MKLRLSAYTKPIIIISFMISAGIILFIAFNANDHLSKMSDNNSELYSAYRISELMKSFKSNLLTLENKQKGYLITGDGKYLEEYKIKESETKTHLKSMEKYFSGKPEEEIFYKLKDLTYKKLMEAKNLDQGSNLAGFSGRTIAEEIRSSTMKDIHSTIEEINKSLSETTKILIDNSIEYVQVSKKWSVLEVLIGVIVSFVALLLLISDINIRNKLEGELRVAKKQAEDNAKMKEQFMANMSHEIRTPMNAILGFTDLLNKTKLGSVQSGYLSAIKTSGSNLLNVINDILDFSKIEAGKLRIEKISFSLSEVMESVRMMFIEKATKKDIRYEVDLDKKIPALIFGDPTRLTQILVNLVSNAIKFTESGQVHLSCAIKSIEHDIVQLVFRVKDTGIGIPADKIDEVFERFNQGNKETTRKYGGTGLGLSIVKSLVEMQNGDLQVKSKEGLGSEFTVTLSYPVSYESIPVQKDQYHEELPKISGNFNVLLAEDNDLNQKLAVTYLNSFGLSVDIADNGIATLEKLKNKQYDLVLMDIQMPLLDGYHTAQKIREDLKLKTPIIAMTAHIMDGEKEKCAQFGMNDYISKPFKESELHAVVKKHLNIENRTEASDFVKPNTSNNKKKTGVDLDELYELSRGNHDFIKEMIDLFIERNPSDLSEIEHAVKNIDFIRIQAVSHRMKTSLGFMGLKHLIQSLDQIETLASEKQKLDEISFLLSEIKKDCLLAIIEFKVVLAELQKNENKKEHSN